MSQNITQPAEASAASQAKADVAPSSVDKTTAPSDSTSTAQSHTTPTQKAPTFVPGLLFFYGSLMDPDVLQRVTKTPGAPVLHKGWIEGFQMKMWSIYPTLIPREGSRVDGMFWHFDDPQVLTRLQDYETDAYKPCPCMIYSEEDGSKHSGATFCWAGKPDSRDLYDGSFDLEWYQKTFKPSLFR